MSEINAIATNNYILHNIDAKKLYVQEPLFTANSGDAVYVGWRPDETVLWEATTPVSGVNIPFVLSEPYTNFEKLRFVCGLDNTKTDVELYTDNTQTFGVSYNSVRASNNAAWETWMAIDFSTTTIGSIIKTRTNKWTLNDTSTTLNAVNKDWEWACRSLKKIIGVNRKENT